MQREGVRTLYIALFEGMREEIFLLFLVGSIEL